MSEPRDDGNPMRRWITWTPNGYEVSTIEPDKKIPAVEFIEVWAHDKFKQELADMTALKDTAANIAIAIGFEHNQMVKARDEALADLAKCQDGERIKEVAVIHEDCYYWTPGAWEKFKQLEKDVAAYKKAKEENDERFQLELGLVRAELERVTGKASGWNAVAKGGIQSTYDYMKKLDVEKARSQKLVGALRGEIKRRGLIGADSIEKHLAEYEKTNGQ